MKLVEPDGVSKKLMQPSVDKRMFVNRFGAKLDWGPPKRARDYIRKQLKKRITDAPSIFRDTDLR